MQKIPTLFKRDPDDMRRVLPEITPGCEWVLAGEGVATRKYDGTCVMCDEDGEWWARREVKPSKTAPMGYVPISTDENTGKTVGWEPMAQSAFSKFHVEALGSMPDAWKPGTYELCGPKINKNPERYVEHELVPHAKAQLVSPFNLTFDGLRMTVEILHAKEGIEGIVWHHPDGRMAKLKARDFPESPGSGSLWEHAGTLTTTPWGPGVR